MSRVFERLAYTTVILSLVVSLFHWRELDAGEVARAAILKIADITEGFGNLDVSVHRVDKKPGGVFTVSGITSGHRSVINANGVRQNITTNFEYQVDMEFWCAKQVETCANFKNVTLFGNDVHVPVL